MPPGRARQGRAWIVKPAAMATTSVAGNAPARGVAWRPGITLRGGDGVQVGFPLRRGRQRPVARRRHRRRPRNSITAARRAGRIRHARASTPSRVRRSPRPGPRRCRCVKSAERWRRQANVPCGQARSALHRRPASPAFTDTRRCTASRLPRSCRRVPGDLPRLCSARMCWSLAAFGTGPARWNSGCRR